MGTCSFASRLCILLDIEPYKANESITNLTKFRRFVVGTEKLS